MSILKLDRKISTALDTGRGLQLSAQELADLATGGMLDIVAKLKNDFLKERMQCRGTRAASISGAASGSISTGAEMAKPEARTTIFSDTAPKRDGSLALQHARATLKPRSVR
ncbi:hypothetical protein [Sandaracinobacter sp.]|uniref:hypothetical protein n=1 Tax=Sandaracinobacter sp. TaxID=2487581 RepID=UPI0035B340ED